MSIFTYFQIAQSLKLSPLPMWFIYLKVVLIAMLKLRIMLRFSSAFFSPITWLIEIEFGVLCFIVMRNQMLITLEHYRINSQRALSQDL